MGHMAEEIHRHGGGHESHKTAVLTFQKLVIWTPVIYDWLKYYTESKRGKGIKNIKGVHTKQREMV